MLVHLINRTLALHTDAWHGALSADFGDPPDRDDEREPLDAAATIAKVEAAGSELVRRCYGAAAVNLLMLTKRHVKALYGLSDAKCAEFDPSDISRAAELPARAPGIGRLVPSAPLGEPPPQTVGGGGGGGERRGEVDAAKAKKAKKKKKKGDGGEGEEGEEAGSELRRALADPLAAGGAPWRRRSTCGSASSSATRTSRRSTSTRGAAAEDAEGRRRGGRRQEAAHVHRRRVVGRRRRPRLGARRRRQGSWRRAGVGKGEEAQEAEAAGGLRRRRVRRRRGRRGLAGVTRGGGNGRGVAK